jgi:hypothetical protein
MQSSLWGESMKPTVSLLSRVVAAAMALAVTLTSSMGGADDVAVPAELQATLLAKVVSYDRNLSERAGDRVHILVVGQPSNPTSMPFSRQMRQVLSSTKTFGSLPHDEEILEFTSTAALVEKCRSLHISVVYFGPGFEGDVEAIRAALEALPILTVTAVPELVPRGLVLGFDLVFGRPKLLVHLTQARRQKVDLPADVLKLMRVFE